MSPFLKHATIFDSFHVLGLCLLVFRVAIPFTTVSCPAFNVSMVERSSSVVEYRTRNQVSPGSNPSLLPFRKLVIFVLSIDASVDSAV